MLSVLFLNICSAARGNYCQMTLLQVCTVFVLCTRSFETSHRKSENKREVLNKQGCIHADVCLDPTVFVHSTYRSDATSKQLCALKDISIQSVLL